MSEISNHTGNERIYGLDVYRAAAIIIVVLGHGGVIAGDIFWFLPSIPMVDGVELFFVLSGFLIGSILIKIIEKGERFNFKTIANFWKRRWFRTLPNYYLILLVNVLLVKHQIINGEIDQFGVSFIFFTHNLVDGFYGFFWESWSLSVEEWFYIVLPLSIFGFRLFLSKKYALLSTIALLILAPMLYRIWESGTPVDKFGLDFSFRKVVVMRLDTIIYGVLAAYIRFYHSEFWKKSRYVALIIGLTILYFGVTTHFEPNHFYSKTFEFTVISIGAMLLLPMAESYKSYRFKWIGKAVTHISLISYSMYLVNLALVQQVIMKNFPPEAEHERWKMYLLFWGVTIGISTLLYYFFEKPMMKLRDRF